MRKDRIQTNQTDQMIVLTAGIGMFLSTLDTGIINVALPTLVQSFNSSITVMTWTITMYTLALVGTIIIFGRLSDKYGRLKIYASGLIVFFMASILCGLSTSPGELITFRTLQGIGAAMLQGTAVAIITTAIPKERQGVALGTLGVLLGLGPVLGPSIGGFLISLGSWRWIFFINIPITLVGLLGCTIVFKKVKESRNAIQIDLPGSILLGFSVLALLRGLSMLSTSGIVSIESLGPIMLFAILFVLFFFWERKAKEPIVNLKLFLHGDFAAPVLGIFVLGGATSLGFIVPPYFLEQVSKLEPWQAGLVNLSAPLGLVLMSKVSGRLIEKAGTTRLMMIGLIIMAVTYGILGIMQSNWSPSLIATLLMLYGVGAGFFVPPNTSAIMSAVGREIQGTIGAFQRMMQNLGIALYATIASVFIRTHSHSGIETIMSGFREAWIFASGTILLSLLIFIFVFRRNPINQTSDIYKHTD
ncbi:MFS transporter [Bacillus sp. BRMEA1]|uniref:MFS transporter n=1 Tax=Neobacillus endophyticus TaxID=2738405 RepID=UPI0015671790|nr:MFS transporter [Neobacillus endophyticus]NRD80933.1 MFS transporter [Neobacillus endophyticus]